MSFKLIIAGSRDIYDYDLVRSLVMKSGFWKAHKKELEILCGMAVHWKWKDNPTVGGVDRNGYEFGKKNGLVVHERPADWKAHGKAAGGIRNLQMANEGDGLLAVWDGKSSGTKDMIDISRAKGLEVKAYEVHRMWAIEELEA